MSKATTNQVQHQLVHQLSANTGADPRTVKKVLDGQPVRGNVKERIQSELQRLTTKPKAKK